MRIHIKDNQKTNRFSVQVNLDELPATLHLNQKGQKTISLDWDRALDDENHLRHCPVCGCEKLYVKKLIPRVIAFALIALAAVIAMIITGLAHVTWAVIVFLVILVIDLFGWFMQGKILICYHCESEFSGLPIQRNHPTWNQEDAQKYGANTGDTKDSDTAD